MVSLQCTNLETQMTEMGQKPNPPFSGLRQLPPPADITNRAEAPPRAASDFKSQRGLRARSQKIKVLS
jgi:hypothetical protein